MNEDGVMQAHRRALERYRLRCRRFHAHQMVDGAFERWVHWVRDWESALQNVRDRLVLACRREKELKLAQRKRDRGKNQPRNR